MLIIFFIKKNKINLLKKEKNNNVVDGEIIEDKKDEL